jgi:hypothetical protein
VHLSTCQAINLFRQASVRRKWFVNASSWVLDCVPTFRASSFCHFIFKQSREWRRQWVDCRPGDENIRSRKAFPSSAVGHRCTPEASLMRDIMLLLDLSPDLSVRENVGMISTPGRQGCTQVSEAIQAARIRCKWHNPWLCSKTVRTVYPLSYLTW